MLEEWTNIARRLMRTHCGFAQFGPIFLVGLQELARRDRGEDDDDNDDDEEESAREMSEAEK
jgi:hypothetical protein